MALQRVVKKDLKKKSYVKPVRELITLGQKVRLERARFIMSKLGSVDV